MKEKLFVSIIWGYSTHMYGFSPEENYHLHALKIAKIRGFKTIVIVKESKENMENDPNFDKGIEVIGYKNFTYFILNVIRFSLKGAIFYVNSLEWQSFVVPFLSKKTIFMAHTQPKRQTKLKQFVQKIIFLFFKAIRLNNEEEKSFLIKHGTSEKKLFVVPLAVSQKVFKVLNEKEDRNDLVCFGNITKKKNIITVLKAFEEVKKFDKEIKLNLIGNLWDEDVKIFAEKSEFKNDIIFHGFIPNEKLVIELNSNLIYINSSFDEGQCVAVYDAALCGCVLCLPNIMSFTGVFKNKALFHNTLDYKKLSENILTYLNDNILVENSRKSCIDMIINNYSEDAIDRKFSEILLMMEDNSK